MLLKDYYMPSHVIIFLPLPKSLHSGNAKAKNEKRNHSEHYRLTVKKFKRLTLTNVKLSRDTFKPINSMDFSLRYGKLLLPLFCYSSHIAHQCTNNCFFPQPVYKCYSLDCTEHHLLWSRTNTLTIYFSFCCLHFGLHKNCFHWIVIWYMIYIYIYI